MERQSRSNERVQISQEVYEGLEIIRQSGATNMLDKPLVTYLAHEWGLEEAAGWLEIVDTKTYGRLIFMGPEVVEAETIDEKLDRLDRAYDDERRSSWEGDPNGMA